jgi:hypothetical protein
VGAVVRLEWQEAGAGKREGEGGRMRRWRRVCGRASNECVLISSVTAAIASATAAAVTATAAAAAWAARATAAAVAIEAAASACAMAAAVAVAAAPRLPPLNGSRGRATLAAVGRARGCCSRGGATAAAAAVAAAAAARDTAAAVTAMAAALPLPPEPAVAATAAAAGAPSQVSERVWRRGAWGAVRARMLRQCGGALLPGTSRA